MTDFGVLRHLPKDLRDTDVVQVRVVAPNAVFVVHRDGTYATHVLETGDFGDGDFAVIGTDPAVFATAAVINDTLAWNLGVDLIYDVAPDSLWLHAHGWCDGSHDLSKVVRGTALRDGVIGLEWVELTADEATARRLHVAEKFGLKLPVSEYEASLYRAEGRPVPEQ